jgi:signal transduction histidine kinase
METHARFIEAFQRIFVLTMMGLILLAGGIGWFMARRALSGVADVTRTARHISDGALDRRVPQASRAEEIDQLAGTFNHMLDRIQGLIGGMREMSDNIAHDLKSPLTRIRGLAEVTLTTGESLDDYQSMAANTVEECDRLLDQINTMLAISKAEGGVETLDLSEMDLAALVRDACELFLPSAEDKRLALVCEAPVPCPLHGDASKIRRMIANLLDNALKYTPAGGTVRVAVHGGGQAETVLEVQDTGGGISAADLPHIFERFYRCDQSRSEMGAGLGLSLAATIARAHGGAIVAESQLGQGSRFTVRLPARPGDQ